MADSLLLQWALYYASRGWSVFPLQSGKKIPFGGSHGRNDATTDPEQLRRWWTEYPDANIGIATGAQSQLLVLDVDVKAGKDGVATLDKLLSEHGPLPPTGTARSGSGGWHFYFWHDGSIRNAIGALGSGLDVLGEGGSIVAPPSRLDTGGDYKWVAQPTQLAVPPKWLVERLTQRSAGLRAHSARSVSHIGGSSSPSLGEAVAAVRNAVEGTRNEVLYRACLALGPLVASGTLNEDQAIEAMLEAAFVAGLSRHEAIGTIQSGLRTGVQRASTSIARGQRLWVPDYRLWTPDELSALPPPKWLIERRLVEAGFSCLYGPPNVGKSFMALHLALCLVSGVMFDDAGVSPGNVVYVAAEAGSGIRQRLDAWKLHHPGASVDRLRVVTDAVQLLDMDQVTAFIGRLGELADAPKLIILDTLSRCMVGGDENSQKDMGLAVAAIADIQRHTGAHVMVVHHTDKQGRAERGSNVLRGAADTMMAIKREGGVTTLSCDKQKEAEPFAKSDWELVSVAASCVPVRLHSLPTKSRAEVKLQSLADNQARMLSTVRAHPNGITLSQALAASGVKKSSGHDALAALVELGAIVKVRDRRRTVYRPAGGEWSSFGVGSKDPQPHPDTGNYRILDRTFSEPNYRTMALDQ